MLLNMTRDQKWIIDVGQQKTSKGKQNKEKKYIFLQYIKVLPEMWSLNFAFKLLDNDI